MISTVIEKKLSWLIMAGTALSMLMVTTFVSIEPVNTPKALILIPLGTAAWFGLFQLKFKPLATHSKPLLFGVAFFSIFVLANILITSAPKEQTLYGSFG